MTAFVVLTTAADIIASIKRVYGADHYNYASGEFFVVDEGVTAAEVHKKLAIDPMTKAQSQSTVVICAVGGYYGIARKDLWEWLTAKGNAVKHGL